MRCLAVFIAFCAFAAAQDNAVEQAWGLLRQGLRPQAVALLRRIIAERPRDAEARLLLGSILQEDGNRDESVAQLTEAVRLRPQSAEAHNALGEALNAFGERAAARPEFEAAVRLDPAFAQAQVNLGLVLLQAGQFHAAGEALDRALQLLPLEPDTAYAHYLRAKVATEQNAVDQAAAQLSAAVALRPDFAEAWSDLGQARKTLLQDAPALAAFERAAALSPADPVVQTRLGSELLDEGKIPPAVKHLREAARLDTRNQTALYKLQLALRAVGQREEADLVKRRLSELLLENDRRAQRALSAVEVNNQGSALEKTGDLRGALEKYRAALQLNPDHAGIRVNLAVVLLRLGRWDDGMAELRETLKRDPGNSAARAAIEDAQRQRPPK